MDPTPVIIIGYVVITFLIFIVVLAWRVEPNKSITDFRGVTEDEAVAIFVWPLLLVGAIMFGIAWVIFAPLYYTIRGIKQTIRKKHEP